MTKFAWLLVAVLALEQCCQAYKVLVMFPMASKSHSILGNGIVKNLLEAGHEVTYVTPYPEKKPPPRLHQVDISDSVSMAVVEDKINVTALLEGTFNVDLLTILNFIESVNKDALTSPNFQKLLDDTSQTFDVVIAEWLFGNIYSGLGYVYSCPFIWVSSVDPHSVLLSLIDEHTHPAYVPDCFSNSVPPFNFGERVMGLLFQAFSVALGYFYLDSLEGTLFEEILGPHIMKRGLPMVALKDLKYNASLILGNSHVSLGQATRLPQAYKPIAGYHIDNVVKPLPDRLQKLLDNAKNGLIYFSLGSIVRSKELPDVLKIDLLEVFGGLKQTVLWKFEEVLPNAPPNVHIVDWAPQQSILDHPNCILFVTHGGLLSITEAVHFGKPIVGIPVVADQFNNIDRAVSKGFARRVDLAFGMKDKLRDAIHDLLHNKRYAEKAKELSLIYHDRPIKPSKEMVHWVEHVVKTKGARHLRSPALDVPVYQKLYLDLLGLVLVVLYVIKKIVAKLCCSRKSRADKKKKRN